MQRCIQRIVQNVRKQVTQQHVDGFNLKDSFGSLHVLCATNLSADLMRKHNDPEDAYHFRLFEFVVLGSQVSPERDIVRITFSSVWMILNAFRAIVAGWGFQLNDDVTGKLCRNNIDLVEFGVNSIPKHNNVLCLGVILKGTESEKIMRSHGMTFAQLQFLCALTSIAANPDVRYAAQSWRFSQRTTCRNILVVRSFERDSFPWRVTGDCNVRQLQVGKFSAQRTRYPLQCLFSAWNQ